LIARNFISPNYPTVRLTDSNSWALETMEEFQVDRLPVVSDGKFLGYVFRTDIQSRETDAEILEEDVNYPDFTLSEKDDYLRVLQLFSQSEEEVLAVLNEAMYHGSVTLSECSMALADTLTAQAKGGALLISVDPRDYSLSQIARLAESEDTKITGLWIEKIDNNGHFIVFLKLNSEYVSGVADLLEMNGYKVIYRSGRQNSELINERYNSLMKYLDL